MKVEITKIKIQLKDKEIELSLEEARAVRAELNKLFFKDESVLPPAIKEPIYTPYPIYHTPVVIERDAPWWPKRWEFTCSSDSETNGTLCMSPQ